MKLKSTLKWLAVLLFCSALAGSARAQSRVATIDLGRVFTNYWKTQDINDNLQKEQAGIVKEEKDMMDEYNKLKDEYQKLLDSANDQTLSAEEREKRKTTATRKLQDMREQETTIRTFDATKKAELDTKSRRLRENILVDIRNVVNARAKANGYSLVIDTAAFSPALTPIVVYNNGEFDLTENVMSELNKLAPPDRSKPLEKIEADKPDAKKSAPGKSSGK